MGEAGKHHGQRKSPAGDRIPGRLGRVLIISLTFWSLAAVAAVWRYYTVQKRAIEEAAMRETSAVAAGKSAQISNWRSERIGDGHVVMSSPVLETARRVLSSRATAERDRANLQDLMRRLADAFLYTDISLVDLDGDVRVRLNEKSAAAPEYGIESRKELARRASQIHEEFLSELTQETSGRQPRMALVAPVTDLGAFILDIDPSRFLYPYLENWPGTIRTRQCELVRRDGDGLLTLNTNLHAGLVAFRHRAIHGKSPPEAMLDAGFTTRGVDYRGVPIIGTARWIPNSPWYVIAKMDAAEVDEPVRRLGWEMALATALIGMANAAGAGLIWRNQQARIHRDREAWFYAAANDTPAYLWMSSPAQENSFVNKPLQQFLGIDRESLADTWPDYVHPEDAPRTRASYAAAMEQKRGYTDEFRVRRFDGEYRTVAGEVVPRFSATGQFLGFAGALVDITGRRRAEEQLRATNAKLEAELAETVRKEKEIQALSARLIGAREEERRRLAHELHDDLNQQIAAISIGVGNLKLRIPAVETAARAQSDRIHQKLVDLAEAVRRMSHELHPAILEYRGLTAALRACSNEFTAMTHINVALKTDGSFDDVPSSTALCIYRITQEALQNVAKHARAESAQVELGRTDGVLCLKVSDNGIGMQPTGDGTGLGLLSMKERVRVAGGTVEFWSEPGKGTAVTVRVPV